MSGEPQGRVSPHVLFGLAGIEVGVLGGVAMFAWFAFISAWFRGSIWIVPNLLASILYGRTVLRSEFGTPALAGLALLLAAAGMVGLVFGLLVGNHRNRVRVTLLALLTGLIWYYATQVLFWNRLGVLSRIYIAPAASMTAHLIFGLLLAMFPYRLSSVRRQFEGTPPPEHPEPEPPPAGEAGSAEGPQ